LINEEFAAVISAYICRFIVTDSFSKFKENLDVKEQQGAIFGYLLLVISVLTTAFYYLWEYFAVRHLKAELLNTCIVSSKEFNRGENFSPFCF